MWVGKKPSPSGDPAKWDKVGYPTIHGTGKWVAMTTSIQVLKTGIPQQADLED